MDPDTGTSRGGDLTAPGTTIGRYIVLHKLGHGAMGVVLAAYDPELDRKLAIKVVRPDPLGLVPGEEEQKRLLREAQAMASLAHPNVVTVFDVGTVDDRVFIAMEYLDAVTAGEWLKDDRSREEVLQVFQAAGRGLAAAHRTGLVHRDFKLDNVLVSRDGRVKVMDFGLARPLPTDPDTLTTPAVSPAELPASGGSARHLDASLTAPDMIAGTPSYIAPECLRGQPATPLSDQFSFCVALYRALYGEYPFPRRTIMELLVEGHGPLREPPLDSRVPHWIRTVLLRGLADDPGDRFPHMEALLEALDRDPVRRRRRLALGAAGTVAAAALVAGMIFMARQPALRCEGAGAAVERVWNPGVKDRLLQAFLATGNPMARGAWERVARAIDVYARSWREMRVEACRATRVTGEQSEELLDLRMACLDNRLQELGSLLEQLAEPDSALVATAPRAVLDLSGLETCADTTALTSPVPPPRNTEIRGRVRELRRQLATARGRWITGNVETSIEAAASIVEAARALDYPPLLAEALTLQGTMEEASQHVDSAREHLEEGLAQALAGGHDAEAVRALIGLTWLDGNDTFDFPRAHTWARLGEAILARIPRERQLELDLANALGSTCQAEGRIDEAMEQHRKALQLAEALHGPDSYFVGRTLGNMANVELARANFQAALELLERAVPLIREHLGDSINTAMAENSLASALMELGRYREAREHFEQARVLYAGAVGENGVWTAIADLNLAQLDVNEGDHRGALETCDRIQDILAGAFPGDHPYSTYLDFARGCALLGLGKVHRALPHLERAYRIRSSAEGVGPYDRAQAAFALARALWSTGRRSRARALAREAAGILHALPAGPMPFRDTVDAWLASRGGPGSPSASG